MDFEFRIKRITWIFLHFGIFGLPHSKLVLEEEGFFGAFTQAHPNFNHHPSIPILLNCLQESLLVLLLQTGKDYDYSGSGDRLISRIISRSLR